MKNAIKFLMRPAYRKYRDLLSRISNLETIVDCLIKGTRWVESDGIGFNGQRHRKAIFQDLLKLCDFDAILETGTWIGDTTGYMAHTSDLPVYTCELNERFFSLAKMRLVDIPNITFELGDSRVFLEKMASTYLVNKRLFVYLDAHWYEDLPLHDEIEIICSKWQDFVIMIDDFQVPDDDGYGYDSYGKTKTLSLEVFGSTFSRHGLVPFFPTASSIDETGFKRGCVVLGSKGEYSESLDELGSLRRRKP